MSLAVAPDQFAVNMEATARKLLGDPNARLSTEAELRFGSQGSVSVDLERGTWFDHEAKVGGGVMDLIARETKLRGQEAIGWLRRECGAQFEDRQPEAPAPKARLIASYDYVDEDGEVLFQVCRFEPKTFRQRKPDPTSRDGWSWSVKGARPILYRLPQVLQAIKAGEMVYIVEGEKDADNLAKEGACATCNPMGAGKWSDALSALLKGADVVILPDNDDAGQNHAAIVGASLRGVARSVRVLDLPDLPPKGDVSDWLAAGGDETELTIMACKAKAWAPEAPKSRFGAIQWADLDAVQVRQDWLIEDMMFGGDIGMVYGASGSGKSFLMVHAGLCIARGVPFLGKATRKGSVLYQAGEGGKGLVKRLRAYRQEFRCQGEEVPFVLLPARVDLFSPDGDVDAFIEECMAWKAALPEPLALIAIDTFSTASPGANENASEDMSRLIKAGEAINQATGAALMWVHHKNAAGDRERGHTSLRANIDTAIEVTKEEDSNIRTARLAKLKDGEDGLKFGFELQPVEIGTYDDGKAITSCVVVPAQVGSPTAGKRARLPKGQYDFLKVLDTAISQYGGVVPGVGSYGVDRQAVKDLFKQLCGYDRTPDAIKHAWDRATKELLVDGLIGHRDQWIWITEKGMRWQ